MGRNPIFQPPEKRVEVARPARPAPKPFPLQPVGPKLQAEPREAVELEPDSDPYRQRAQRIEIVEHTAPAVGWKNPHPDTEVEAASRRFKPSGRRAATIAILTILAPLLGTLAKVGGDSFNAYLTEKSKAAEARAARVEVENEKLRHRVELLEQQMAYTQGVMQGQWRAEGATVRRSPGVRMAEPLPVQIQNAPPQPKRKGRTEILLPAPETVKP